MLGVIMTVEKSLVDLLTPAQAAEELGVNVTTLRKYSLLIEKVAANDAFFARKNNKRRNYTKKNIEDLKAMIELSQRDDMTLELAAQSLFDGQVPDKELEEAAFEGMSPSERKLNEKISKQAREINHLKKQLKDIQQENYALIRALKNTQETPLFDYDMNVNEDLIPGNNPTPAQTSTVQQNRVNSQPQMANPTVASAQPTTNSQNTESKEDKYAEALERARQIRDQKQEQALVDDSLENNPAQPAKPLRTLSNMQIDNSKKKWWQR